MIGKKGFQNYSLEFRRAEAQCDADKMEKLITARAKQLNKLKKRGTWKQIETALVDGGLVKLIQDTVEDHTPTYYRLNVRGLEFNVLDTQLYSMLKNDSVVDENNNLIDGWDMAILVLKEEDVIDIELYLEDCITLKALMMEALKKNKIKLKG